MPSSRIRTLLFAYVYAARAMHSAPSQALVDHARAERDAHRHSLMLAGWTAGRDDVSGALPELPCGDAQERCWLVRRSDGGRGATPTTCIETIGGDPGTALRLSFQIKVF